MIYTIHRINHNPVDNTIDFTNAYPVDSELSGGYCYPPFEQPGLGEYSLAAGRPGSATANKVSETNKMILNQSMTPNLCLEDCNHYNFTTESM